MSHGGYQARSPRGATATLAAVAPKGKWAQGITPRNFCWIVKDRLAVCERPGGYGSSHRRVRRQEEIIWIREQGFSRVISLLGSPHNLHNYDELEMPWLHRPFNPHEGRATVAELYPELRELLRQGEKLVVHASELSDAVTGLMAGYLLWTGMVPEGPRAVSITEQLTQRQLGPVARGLVAVAEDLRSGVAQS